MFYIDEHFEIEEQLVFILCIKVARGVWQAGEFLPPVQDFAKELIINPHKIENALERLAKENLIERTAGTSRIKPEATDKAREMIKRMTRNQLIDIHRILKKCGFQPNEVNEIMKQVFSEGKEIND